MNLAFLGVELRLIGGTLHRCTARTQRVRPRRMPTAFTAFPISDADTYQVNVITDMSATFGLHPKPVTPLSLASRVPPVMATMSTSTLARAKSTARPYFGYVGTASIG